ncbi:hypothetical protein SAMN03159335_00709 [Burkholderia cepacia]|nr:hypothetical protein SAMN03159335_00709 [Burkholderia cepacia]
MRSTYAASLVESGDGHSREHCRMRKHNGLCVYVAPSKFSIPKWREEPETRHVHAARIKVHTCAGEGVEFSIVAPLAGVKLHDRRALDEELPYVVIVAVHGRQKYCINIQY